MNDWFTSAADDWFLASATDWFAIKSQQSIIWNQSFYGTMKSIYGS